MQELLSEVRHGDRVHARGDTWQVIDVDPFERVSLVTLRGVSDSNDGAIARLLTPFDRMTRVFGASRLRTRSRQTVLRAARRAIAEAAPWTSSWTAAAASIDIRAWQLEPARAALSGATRVLLADDVGLGKTIQALLIASELAARGVARRTLILTPAPLREQWAREAARFGFDASVFDHQSLATSLAALPPGVNPWDTAPMIVASIDLAKRAEVRQALDATSFDLLIVDEAHHLTPGSDRAAVVADLATRTLVVVLVTATPHSGDSEAFDLLTSLGEVRGSEPITIFRRRAPDVHRRARRVRTAHVPPTDAERRLLDATLAYASGVWRDGGPGGRLVAAVIARRACSSALAAAATIGRRLALFRGQTIPADDQPQLPWEDEAPDSGLSDLVLSSPGLADRAAEVQQLERLQQLAEAAVVAPSKLAALRRLIARTAESVLVFSEYRDVVAWCADRLSDLANLAVLHGGLAPAIRAQAIRQFNDGTIRVLVATDAAGEGLNLHACCRLVVNLELPWNPLRLEQRVGRVDRIGQRRRVHVRHLVHRGSYEDLVLTRLEERRHLAVGQLDALALSEHDVASSVLGHETLPRTGRPSFAEAAADEAAAAAIVLARRLRSESAATIGATTLVASRPGAGAGRALILLYGVDFVDAHGRLVQRDPLAVRVRLSSSACRRLTPAFVRSVQAHPDVCTVVGDLVSARAAAVSATLTPTAHRLLARLAGMRDAIESRRSDGLLQPSLFDRREEQRAHARRDMTRRWIERLEEREATLHALAAVAHDAPRLLAAWLSD